MAAVLLVVDGEVDEPRRFRRGICPKYSRDASDILRLRWRKFLLFRGEIIISMFPLSWEMMERTSLAFVLYLFSRHVKKSLAM